MSIKIIMSLMRSYFGVCLRANNKTQNFDENILKAPWKVMVCFRVLFEVNTVRQWLTMRMRKKLIEAGFEYVCSHKDEMLLRKRK